MRRLGRWILRLIFLLLLIGLGWGGWYVYKRGFTSKWRKYVIQEFRKRGVEVSFKQLAIDPFAGLVARDVVVKDPKAPGKIVAQINRIVLDINYGNLLHGEPFLNAIDLHNASVSLPVDPSDLKSPKIEVKHLNAHLFLRQNQIYLEQAEALLYGIRISATGQLIHPEAYHPTGPKSGGDAEKRDRFAETIIAELKKLHFDSAPPSLEIRFSGDLVHPEDILVEATLSGKQIQRGTYRLSNLHAALNFRDRICTLKQCVISDKRGTLNASGSLDTAEGVGDFRIRSSLDVQELLREIVPWAALNWKNPLDEVGFYSPPVIEVSGKIGHADKPDFILSGSIAMQKFTLRTAVFDSLSANFSWDGARWYLTNARIVDKSGELTANALRTPDGFRLKLQSTINPKTLLPLLPGSDAGVLSLLEFDQPPRIQFNMRGPSADFLTCELDGDIRLGRTRFRGVALNSATGAVRIKDKAFSYENFKIERPEGTGAGSLTFDLPKNELRVDRVKTRLNPADTILWVNPEFLEHVVPYRFKKTPNLAVNGVVQFGGGKKTNLEILVDAPEGMDYTFLSKTLPFQKVSGKLLFTDDHLKISDFSGALFSGRVLGGAEFSFAKKNQGCTANIAVEKIDFEKLTNLYFNYKDSKGELNGGYKFSMRGGNARTMEGRGEASVNNGNVFAIPVLGPLSGVINDIIPGVGYNSAHRASVNFDIAEGVIHTRDLLVKGGGFSMIGGGDLFFLDDKMNMHVRLNAQGIPGVVLFPVSKLLEYAADGSLSKPVWRPKALPRFQLEKKP